MLGDVGRSRANAGVDRPIAVYGGGRSLSCLAQIDSARARHTPVPAMNDSPSSRRRAWPHPCNDGLIHAERRARPGRWFRCKGRVSRQSYAAYETSN